MFNKKLHKNPLNPLKIIKKGFIEIPFPLGLAAVDGNVHVHAMHTSASATLNLRTDRAFVLPVIRNRYSGCGCNLGGDRKTNGRARVVAVLIVSLCRRDVPTRRVHPPLPARTCFNVAQRVYLSCNARVSSVVRPTVLVNVCCFGSVLLSLFVRLTIFSFSSSLFSGFFLFCFLSKFIFELFFYFLYSSYSNPSVVFTVPEAVRISRKGK